MREVLKKEVKRRSPQMNEQVNHSYGPTKRAADLDDIVSLEAKIVKLQEENKRLIEIEQRYKSLEKENQILREKFQLSSVPKEMILQLQEQLCIMEEEYPKRSRTPYEQLTSRHIEALKMHVKICVSIAYLVAGVQQNRPSSH